ncbi:MAG: tetratricopeptide repeat protein [Planctomycetaceae bacterium]|nr:tetratricopeptide repeat protein [Planctomycetaceae bacterium]
MSTESDVQAIVSPGVSVRRPIKLAALLAAITCVVYVNSLAAQFLFDDLLFVGKDGIIRKMWDWDSWRYLHRAFATWTLQWNYELGRGFYPWQYRLTNVVIHIAAGLTLFGLVRRTLMLAAPGKLRGLTPTARQDEAPTDGRMSIQDRADWLAAAVAILWLVHPLQTQAVTYVVQRYESLMGLFFLLTLYFTVRGAQSNKPRDWYIAAFVACMLGALSKEVIAVCPLVVLLYDRAFLTGSWREAWRRRWPLYAALALPAALVLFASREAFGSARDKSAGFGMEHISAWEYLRSQPGVILHYLRLSFWPDQLILDYGWPVEQSPLAIYGLGAVIVLLVGLSLWATWRHPMLGFLGLAFFLILAPTSSILPIKDLAFEHRMYLPLAAVVVLTVLAVEQLMVWLRLPESVRGHAALVLIAVAAGSLSLRTMLRNRDYHDSIAIWKQCIENNPAHPRPYRILADVYAKQDADVAIKFYKEALAKYPDWGWMWIDLGNAQFKRNNIPAATQAYEHAARIMPDLIESHLNLSRLRMRQGDYAGAVAAVQQGLAQVPDDATALKQLAWLLTTSADGQVRDGKKALAILVKLPQEPDRIDIQYLEVLSAAHAEVGDFDQAVIFAEQALDEARKIKSRRVEEFAERVEMFRAKQPMRMKVDSSRIGSGKTAQAL